MNHNTGFIYSDHFLRHETGAGHPESPQRLTAMVSHLKQINLWQALAHPEIGRYPDDWILKVHTVDHVNSLRKAYDDGRYALDQGDTPISAESFDVARLAVDAVLTATEAVMNGTNKNAFCAVRPPGHHAERDKAMGFCLLNNVAIGARFAQQKFGAERVAVIDWDVHHGNGIQNLFYDDDSVLYISTHQFPFYPGSGSRGESGTGKGDGFTINIPMMAGSGEGSFLDAFNEIVIPSLENYRADIIFLSAGFDAHRDDPLANLNLTERTFGLLTSMIAEKAESVCSGRIVSVLEGGYNLLALPLSVEAHLRALMGNHETQ